jgi:hypothetical protein
MNDLARRRIAVAAHVAALAGAIAYAMERGYAHLQSGGGAPAIILREPRIGYLLALAIAALVSLVAALVTAELAATETRVAATERVLERVVLPAMLIAAALMFVWP